jgi:hypothetical protein
MALSRLSAKARQTDRTVFGYRDRSNMAVVDDGYVFCAIADPSGALGFAGLEVGAANRGLDLAEIRMPSVRIVKSLPIRIEYWAQFAPDRIFLAQRLTVCSGEHSTPIPVGHGAGMSLPVRPTSRSRLREVNFQ